MMLSSRAAILAVLLSLAGCAPKATPPPATTPPPAGEAPPPAAPAEPGRPFPQPALGARWKWIEVGLLVAADSAHIETSGEADVEGLFEVRTLTPGRWITARARQGRVLVQPSPGFRELGVYEVADTLRIVPRSPSTYVVAGGKRYRGSLKIFRAPGGGVTVVNLVPLEDYLRGVLPHEIGKLQDATLEAGKAQAVAARTYALAYIGRRSDQGFDVYATVEDQLYGGAGDEGPLTDHCVRETSALVCTSSGRLIRANYFSTCGGVTANVEDVWPEPPLPWLRSVPDERDGHTAFCSTSPQFRWTEIWDVPEFLRTVNRTFPALIGPIRRPATRLEGIRVRTRSSSGRVGELVIETDAGNLVVHGDSTRRVLLRPSRSTGAGGGGGLLRSSLFKIEVVRNGAGRATAVVATGAGFGHGVGMCQWGALEMSRRGYDFRTILGHYFRGTTVRNAEDLAG
jgi:stage II sporulation protein D